MTTSLISDVEVQGQASTVRYFGELTPLAESDTIGITADAVVFLHTVPAGGQTLDDALRALCVLIGANALYGAWYSPNSPFDQCLYVRAIGLEVNTTLVTPVYVVA